MCTMRSYIIERISNVNAKLYLNGVAGSVSAIASVQKTGGNIFIGARNLDGVPDFFTQSTISSFVIGAAIGFNHTSFNTALQKLVS